jgi:hypothetical protein
MAKKLSYTDLQAKCEMLDMRAHVLTVAATEMPDDVYRHRDGRDTYNWKAYRLDGAAGGYLTCVYNGFANDRKSLHYAERLDTAIQQVRERGSIFQDNGMADAVSRFHSARYNMTAKTA